MKSNNRYNKFIICSENVPLYYNQSLRLNDKLMKIVNLKDDNIKTHPDVSPNSVPEQLMILNYLLSGKSILNLESSDSIKGD